MRTRRFIVLSGLATATVLGACEGLKEALTAHVDVVAKAGSQELSVERLGSLLGNAKIPVPVTKENADLLARIWSYYQRLGYAAAHGDSLVDKIDLAIAPLLRSERVMIYQDSMAKTLKSDSATEAGYNSGARGLYAARHILLMFPQNPTPAQKDSVRKAAAALRTQVTAANFADMAKKKSQDPGSAPQGGDLGIFPKSGRGSMVPEFTNGTVALKPGEVSPPVESEFGLHIIQRRTYADVKDEYDKAFASQGLYQADSAWKAGLSTEYDIKVKDGAAADARGAVKEEASHRKDSKVLSTFKGGSLTVSEFLDWVDAIPPQYQVAQQLSQAPDSLVTIFLKSMTMQEVFAKKAEEAKIDVPAAQKDAYRQQFRQMITGMQQQLGISPDQLKDSAKTTSEKEKLASARVESLIDRFMNGEAAPVDLPKPLKAVIDAKYDVTISNAGLERAVEHGTKLRAAADSARAANAPPSQVPMPGLPPSTNPTRPDTTGTKKN